VNRQEIARKRRRESIDAMLEVEQEREEILRHRLEELIGDADGWKVDDEIAADLPEDDVRMLRQMLVVESEPDEDAKERYENDIRDCREDIGECERRQRALRRFLHALGG
jgi:hypothetical protein